MTRNTAAEQALKTDEGTSMIEIPEPPHPPHKGAGHNWFDAILAISLLVVSVVSVSVAWHTSHTMEKLVKENARLVRASSSPLLQYGTSNVNQDREQEISFDVLNVGSGPARIVWFDMTYKMERVNSVHDLLKRLENPPLASIDGGLDTITSRIAPRLVPTGANVQLFVWPRPTAGSPEERLWLLLNRERFNVSVEACFCSLFDECWTSDMQGDVPKPVQTCDRAAVTPFGE